MLIQSLYFPLSNRRRHGVYIGGSPLSATESLAGACWWSMLGEFRFSATPQEDSAADAQDSVSRMAVALDWELASVSFCNGSRIASCLPLGMHFALFSGIAFIRTCSRDGLRISVRGCCSVQSTSFVRGGSFGWASNSTQTKKVQASTDKRLLWRDLM